MAIMHLGDQIDVSYHPKVIRTQSNTSLPVCKSVEEASNRPFTHVIITTKAVPELLRTPDILSPLLVPPFTTKHPQPIYVALQNGLNVENDLYVATEALGQGKPNILGAAVYIGVNVLDDGVVEHKGFNVSSLSNAMDDAD